MFERIEQFLVSSFFGAQLMNYFINYECVHSLMLQDTSSRSVFISYCWLNSSLAVNAGQARNIPGAVSYGDPRELKQFLEDNDISCWLDIDQVGRVSRS